MSAEDRIPVSEDTHKQLHQLKDPGQTYDELLRELAQERNRHELAGRFAEMDEMDSDEFVTLDDV